MGEIADSMLDGTLCECCGVFLGEDVIIANGGKIIGNCIEEVPGFPIKCKNCLPYYCKACDLKVDKPCAGKPHCQAIKTNNR